jgi:hypothetical protein
MELIVDPYNYNKLEFYNKTIKLSNYFCEINGLEIPKVIIDETINSTGLYVNKKYCSDGESKIYIAFKKCRFPVKKPGFQWSFTGYKSDKTVSGVICHELGHHFHFSNNIKVFIEEFNKLKGEDYLTSYHPNTSEDIAESIRLFILNPDLLKKLRPKRYFKLLDLGLKQITNYYWADILKFAPKEIINQCNKRS